MILHRNKRKVAIFLVMLLIFTMFISYKQEADAIAPVVAAVAVVGVSLAAYALVTAGITFATTGDAQQAAQAVYTQFQTKFDQVVNSGKVMLALGTMSYKYVCTLTDDLWTDIKTWTDSNYNEGQNVSIDSSTFTNYSTNYIYKDGVSLFKIHSIDNTKPVYNCDIEIVNGQIKVTDSGGGISTYDTQTWGNLLAYRYFNMITIKNESNTHSVGLWIGDRQTDDIVCNMQTGGSVVSGQTGIVDNPEWTWSNPETGTKPIDIPLVGSPGAEDADFGYTNSAGDQVGLNVDANVLDGVINKTADDVIGASVAGTGAIEIEGTTAITNEATTDYVDPATNTSETETSLKYLLLTKFPFCLPWDLYNAIALLNKPAVVPRFETDFYGELSDIPYGGSTNVVLDFAEFEVIGEVSRWTATVGFCIMLILATKKLIWS